MYHIYPSLMSAPLLDLGATITKLSPFVQGFHIDIMDLHFAPNLTFGPDFINTVIGATPLPVWVHLMVEKPIGVIERISLRPIDIVSIHAEIAPHELRSAYEAIKAQHARISIAINPETPVQILLPYLAQCQQVLVMAVEPGFSGQTLLPNTLHKVDALCTLRKHYPKPFEIALDGGINRHTIKSLATYAVDALAIGSGIFHAEDPVAEVRILKQ